MVGRKVAVRTVVMGWVLATIAGIAALAAYAGRPGDVGRAPDTWPSEAPFAHSTSRATLVVALHPGCACSKATVAQLARLAARDAERLDIVALTATYPEFPADDDVLRAALAAVPGVRRVSDPRARIAARFGALTSGHAVLFDASGRVRFTGGLTSSRGHEGDSAGLDFVRAYLEGPQPATAAVTAPVFGCALAHHEAAS